MRATRRFRCKRRVASAANDASLPLQTTRRLRCQRRVVCAGHDASLRCQRRVACARHDASLAWGTTRPSALATTRRYPAQATRPRRWRCQRRVVCAGHGASLSCQRRVACARHDASLAWGTTRRLALAATRRYPAQTTRRLGSTPSAADGTLRAFGKEPADFNICFARPLRSLRFCNTFCHPVLAVRWQCCSKLAAMRGSY